MHPAGGVRSLSPAAPAFSLLSCPHPPDPLPLRGRGRFIVFLCKGRSPLHPQGWAGRGTCTTKGFCLFTGGAVPAAKERGDRGRWNYPSHATAAFEMVLSPGAGRASAANGLMQGCRGRSPRRNKLIVSPFPAGEGGRGDRGQNQSKRQGRQATKKASPPLWSQETTPHPPCHTAKKRQKKSPEPRIRADSGQSQSYSGKVPGARGTLSGAPRRFSFLSTDPKPCHQGDPG